MTGQLRVVLATGNPGKTREFGRLLGPDMAVEPLPASVCMPAETEASFSANARLKAKAVFGALAGAVAVLADDSGLEVERLGGRPGVLSARFAGEGSTDEDNVSKLLAELGDEQERDARFVCSLCLVLPDPLAQAAGAKTIEVEGVLRGRITLAPKGEDGFGYDPVFLPVGWGSTLAEAEPADKDGVSHRGAACRALMSRLSELRLLDSKES